MKPITKWHNEEVTRLIFDLDGLVAIHPKDNDNYLDYSTPDEELVELMKKLQKKGFYIIIHTARRMRTCESKIGRVLKFAGEKTFKWLRKYKIPYDEIIFGKPFGHRYYDDLALNYNREDMIKDIKKLLK